MTEIEVLMTFLVVMCIGISVWTIGFDKEREI